MKASAARIVVLTATWLVTAAVFAAPPPALAGQQSTPATTDSSCTSTPGVIVVPEGYVGTNLRLTVSPAAPTACGAGSPPAPQVSVRAGGPTPFTAVWNAPDRRTTGLPDLLPAGSYAIVIATSCRNCSVSVALDAQPPAGQSRPAPGEEPFGRSRLEGQLAILKLTGLQADLARLLYEVNTGQRETKSFFQEMTKLGGTVGDVAAVNSRLSGAWGRTNPTVAIALLLYDVRTHGKTPESFYADLSRVSVPKADGTAPGATMFDVINTRSLLVDFPDASLARSIMGQASAAGGTPVEQLLLTWRRTATLEAIDAVVRKFVAEGRIPANGSELIISHVGKWATQADSALTFTGDIDFSFVCSDVALATAMKEEFAQIISSRTGLDPRSFDSVATAHGLAGLEVYIGKWGMAFAEAQMKVNEVVDLSTGNRRKADAAEVATILAAERDLAAAEGRELPTPSKANETEPGLSMEMVRHFQHDIVAPGIFDVTNAIVKAAKYLDRSFQSFEQAGGKPSAGGQADLAAFSKRITALANTKPQTPQVRNEMIELISTHLGTKPSAIWDAGTKSLRLNVNAEQVRAFHQKATAAMWETVKQASRNRTADIESRLRDLEQRKSRGDNVEADTTALRDAMVDLVDMVEAEIKATGHSADVPIEIQTNNAKVRELLNRLSRGFGVKSLSADELKEKRFVEDYLRKEAQQRSKDGLRALGAYIRDRAARAVELPMEGVEGANTILDFVDDRLLGPLRQDPDFVQFEAAVKAVRASGNPATARERLATLKAVVAASVQSTNQYLNEALQRTAAGRQGMKGMTAYGLIDEMVAYRDAYGQDGWGGVATEMFRRRVPLGSAVESAMMGNYMRAGWDFVTTLVPPLALPEAAYGLGTRIGDFAVSTYWSEQLALFVDTLYRNASFMADERDKSDNPNLTKFRLLSVTYKDVPIDLKGFAKQRKEEVDALRAQIGRGHLNWRAYASENAGLTSWMELDKVLQKNIAATDPALVLLDAMVQDPNVGPKLLDRLAEKGLVRWEEVKLGFITNLITRLEDRRAADFADVLGNLPELFAELRQIAADLEIEDAVLRGLDAEVDTSNLKKIVNWLWAVKRNEMQEAPVESERTRAAEVVIKYLEGYRSIVKTRNDALASLGSAVGQDGQIRFLTGELFLTGRVGADLASAGNWAQQIVATRKAATDTLLEIKRTLLPAKTLDADERDFENRLFVEELWIKPYRAAGSDPKLAWALPRGVDHARTRNAVLDEYRAWLNKRAPVQLTVTPSDAGDATRQIRTPSGELLPLDESGAPVTARIEGNRLVFEVPSGRYRLTLTATGYAVLTRDLVLGRNLDPTPSMTIPMTPTGAPAKPETAAAPEAKLPVEKPPIEKPADATPPVAEAKPPVTAPPAESPAGPKPPSAPGKAAPAPPPDPNLGYWLLTDVRESRKTECQDSGGYQTRDCSIVRSGSSVTGHFKIIFPPPARPDLSSYEPAVFDSKISWTEFPKSIAGDAKVTTTATSEDHKSGGPQLSLSGGFFTEDKETRGADSINLSTGTIHPTATQSWRFTPATRFGETRTIYFNYDLLHLSREWTYTYTWTSGLPPDGYIVTISADRPAPKIGDVVTLSAKVTGGAAPYSYAWSGASTGTAPALPFTVSKPGKHDFSVVVTDAKGLKTSGSATVEAKTLVATISVVGGVSRVIPGQTLSFQAQVSSPDGVAPPEGLIYRWQPNSEVTYVPFEGTKNSSMGRFADIGKVRVWVDVLQRSGPVLETVAESNQIEIDVAPPEIRLQVFPAEPYPGQIVRVTASEAPTAGDAISYWWEYAGNAMNTGAEANQRVYTFRPKDTTPVSVTAHGKAKDGGTDLGSKAIVITARPHTVTVTGPTARGTTPQVWDPQRKQLVDVERQLAVFQDVGMRVDVSPAPINAPVRYQWTISPDGCTLSNPISQEPTVNCSQTGSFAASVTATDSLGAKLGTGSGSVSITISQATLQNSQKQAEAARQPATQQGTAPAKPPATQRQADPASPLPAAAATTGADQKAKQQVAQLLRAEAYALQQKGLLREAAEKYRASLTFVADPALEAHIAQVEAEAATQEAAVKAKADAARAAQPASAGQPANVQAAQQLRAEGEALQAQGKLREAAEKYRTSLKFLSDPTLEAHIARVDAEAAKQEAGAKLKAEQDAAVARRAAEDQAAQQKAAEEQAAKQKAADELAAKQRAADELAARQKAADELAAKQKAAAEQAARQKAEQQAAWDRAVAEQAAKQKAAQEEAARQKAADDLPAKQKTDPVKATPPAQPPPAPPAGASPTWKPDPSTGPVWKPAGATPTTPPKTPPAVPAPPQTIPAQPAPTPQANACTLTGDWLFSLPEEKVSMTLTLRQSGSTVEGKLTGGWDAMSGASTVRGTITGRDVRLSVTNADGTMAMPGSVSADCRALNLSVTVDGETAAMAFRRK